MFPIVGNSYSNITYNVFLDINIKIETDYCNINIKI